MTGSGVILLSQPKLVLGKNTTTNNDAQLRCEYARSEGKCGGIMRGRDGLSRELGYACASVFAVAFIAPPIFASVAADELDAGRRELQKAIILSLPRPSLDTYPVQFSVGDIHYRVPRNYLTTMEDWNGGPQAVVTLRVNLPDLEPYSKETFNCFTPKPLDRPSGCEPFSFRINGPVGPSPAEVFERVRHLFHSQVPIEGPYGFEKYEVGPDNARAEYYYRRVDNDQAPFYVCQIFDNRGRRDGLCSPVSDHVATSGTLKFFFNLSHLKDITQIDADLRQLVLRFTVKTRVEQ
jgi:hypothetical protein